MKNYPEGPFQSQVRSYPVDEIGRQELGELHPEPWMVELLKLNPAYTSWGPFEDYMGTRGENWREPLFCQGFDEMFDLDDLNEVVHFYFSIMDVAQPGYYPPVAQVALTLWVLHPRKGCSQAVEIRHIKQADLPDVFAFLRGAAKRNADRFKAIPQKARKLTKPKV